MEIVNGMKIFSFDEVVDDLIGPIGTPERDQMEVRVERSLVAYRARQAKKNAKKEKYMAATAYNYDNAVAVKGK